MGNNNRRRRASARAKKQPRNPFNGQFVSWGTVLTLIVVLLASMYVMATV
ncbi:MAG: hypothetical protein OXC83_10675 [Chloroflexi bacterium]|nr:hypothetical protein [Chloroflexota bacterium]